MRLFEFAEDDPLRVKLTVVANQLKSNSDIAREPMPVQDFVITLQKEGIPITNSDIYDLIKKEPLSNIVDSIDNGHVVFKGQQPEKEMGGEGPDENQKTLQQMAKKQVNKSSPMGL
jgi:hypothetical protein